MTARVRAALPARRALLPDLATAARILPALLAVAGVVTVVCALADVRDGPLHGLRAVATAVFVLLGPGWALAGFLAARSLAERFVVAAGAGVALSVLAGQVMVVSGAWHPVGLLYPVAVLTVPVLVRHALTPRADPSAVSR